jgi:hypothetical protein
VTDRLTIRPFWSILRIAVIGLLMLSLLAACGSDDDDDSSSGSEPTATSATGSTAAETATESDATTDTTGSATTGDMGDVKAVGSCLQEGTTGDMVTDLRDGDTSSTEDLYRSCLGDALPAAMVSQLDPIITQAGDCGSDAAADLSDDDIAAIESGDEAKIQQLTNDTLHCLSADLGIDLQ